MARTREKRNEASAFDIVEEAFQLLRLDPLRRLAPYFMGTLPFILALLYFWADMSKSAFASQRLPGGALLLVGTFLWMKVWHVVYMRRLWADVSAQELPRWTRSRLLNVLMHQAILQPMGMLVLPITLLAVVPYPYAHAFYQNVTALDDGEEVSVRSLIGRAMTQAQLWPKQNSLLIWILSPSLLIVVVVFYLILMPIMQAFSPEWSVFIAGLYTVFLILLLTPLCPLGVVIAANMVGVLVFTPYLAKSLLGIDFGIGTMTATLSTSTFIALVVALVFCCMDPLMKAAYTLRCFYGVSIHTGEDLLVALRHHAGRAASLVVLMGVALLLGNLSGGVVRAEDAVPANPIVSSAQGNVPPQALNDALDRVLRDRRYAWRLPRPKDAVDESALGGIARYIQSIFDTVHDWYKKTMDWLKHMIDKLFPPGEQNASGAHGWGDVAFRMRLVLFSLLAVVLILITYILLRIWRDRGVPVAEAVSVTVGARPDVEDEETTADQYPEEGWMVLARELAGRQEWRLAVRALFLAMLARMAAQEWIRIARFKSNRDYREELRRRTRSTQVPLELFAQNVGIYESTWYGAHEATSAHFDHMMANQEQLRSRG